MPCRCSGWLYCREHHSPTSWQSPKRLSPPGLTPLWPAPTQVPSSPLWLPPETKGESGGGGKSQTFAWALSPAQTKSWLQHLRRLLERQEVVQGFVLQHHSKAEEQMPSDEPPKPQGSPPSPSLPSSCSHVSLRPLQTQTSKELLGDEAGVGETGPSPCHTAPGMSARLAASAGTRFCDRD